MSNLLRALRNADNNEEMHSLYEGQRWIVAWDWRWLDFQVGIAAYLDPSDHPGLWLNLGPIAVGIYAEPGLG